MGRGKTKNTSVSAYDECKNPEIKNTVFISKRNICPENPSERKALSFYSRYYLNSSNRISVTRNPFTADDEFMDRLKITSIFNNPNCILANLSTRDYEVLNYLITGLSKTFRDYYFKENEEDIPPSKLVEIIQLLDCNKLTPSISNMIAPFDMLYIDKVNYETVMMRKNIK